MTPKKRFTAEQRKTLHRRARAALTRLQKKDYRKLLDQVRSEQPELGGSDVAAKARALLQKLHQDQFDILYAQAKGEPWQPVIKKDYKTLAQLVVVLYGDGTGPSILEVAEKVGVGKTFVQKSIADAGVIPPRGRKARKNAQED